MSEIKNTPEIQESSEEQSSLNFQTIYTAFILNWKWFLLSTIICLGLGLIYLRYKSPVYNTTAKLLIKDDQNGGRSRGGGAMQALENMSNLGIISNSYGIENEQEIITSSSIAEQTIRDLKIYVDYYLKGSIKSQLLYKEQPINVDMDAVHLDKLNAPVKLEITNKDGKYQVKGEYYIPINEINYDGPFDIDKTINSLPATIQTRVGAIILTKNNGFVLEDGHTMKAIINSPRVQAAKYMN